MNRIRVWIYASKEMIQSNKRLFERIVDVDDNLTIDFHCIIKALSLLYGETSIINFSIHKL